MQAAFPKVHGAGSRPSQSVACGGERWKDRCPHGDVPVIIVELAKRLGLSVNHVEHCPIERIPHVAYLLDNQNRIVFSPRIDIHRCKIDGQALGALGGLQFDEHLNRTIRIGKYDVVLLDEQDVSIMVHCFGQAIPHCVHHPPPVVLQRNYSNSSVIPILIRIPHTASLGVILCSLAIFRA
ncbi:hypothetical protein Mapa_010585 [Marchantia paleacea]|nr:hypothetical protein Mapa_010585 [Marchantia paleacea]